MTIQPLNTTLQSQNGASDGSTPPTSASDVSQTQFLQLLVAQIQYQDPTNPTDSTTFVTQLAQFSSLEQLVAIRGELATQTPQQVPAGVQNSNAIQGGK
jgi:flagellar basal-body rod modification protein FlgD